MNNTKVSKRILIAEDEDYLRDLYKEILEEEGHKVETAINGREGYTKMQEGGYDLVLLDIIMPKMDGLQILEKLKETPPKEPNKSIVILTNLDQDLTIAKGLSYGIRGYMMKSDYTPDTLLRELQQYLV
jgi:CheY-like chemotaxis protein